MLKRHAEEQEKRWWRWQFISRLKTCLHLLLVLHGPIRLHHFGKCQQTRHNWWNRNFLINSTYDDVNKTRGLCSFGLFSWAQYIDPMWRHQCNRIMMTLAKLRTNILDFCIFLIFKCFTLKRLIPCVPQSLSLTPSFVACVAVNAPSNVTLGGHFWQHSFWSSQRRLGDIEKKGEFPIWLLSVKLS